MLLSLRKFPKLKLCSQLILFPLLHSDFLCPLRHCKHSVTPTLIEAGVHLVFAGWSLTGFLLCHLPSPGDPTSADSTVISS